MRHLATSLLFLVVLMGASRSSSRPELFEVRLPLERTRVETLRSRGFDIAGVDLESNEVVVITDEVGVRQLGGRSAKPIASEVIVETLNASWKKPSDIPMFLQKVEAAYPDLATAVVIGQSTDKQDIWAIKLTDSFSVPAAGKAVILIDAMHHAREVMTPEVALDIVDYLTSRYSTDAQVRKWMRLNEVWVIPMLNPDGNRQVWTRDNMWRKNTRGGYGVDMNRNYPFEWNSCNGSSGSTGAEDYRGPSAGSEPETQAIMELARSINPVFNISYHSASELVIFPMSCPSSKPPAAQRPIVEGIGRDLASKLKRDSGSGTYAPGYSYDLLYPVDGGSNDWMYGELKALSYCIEVSSTNQGFQPSFAAWRDSTVNRNRAGWQWVLDRVNQSAIRARTAPGEAVILENSAGALVTSRRADDSGWAHFIVTPGTYRVLEASNRATVQTATVGSSLSVIRLR